MKPPCGCGNRGQVICPIAIRARYAGSLLHTSFMLLEVRSPGYANQVRFPDLSARDVSAFCVRSGHRAYVCPCGGPRFLYSCRPRSGTGRHDDHSNGAGFRHALLRCKEDCRQALRHGSQRRTCRVCFARPSSPSSRSPRAAPRSMATRCCALLFPRLTGGIRCWANPR